MNSDLDLIAADPGQLVEHLDDPGQFVVLACERAKEWLDKAIAQGQVDEVVDARAKAEAIRVFTTQKHLGQDAELAAAEIVRRAERGIGLCIREAQDAGAVMRPSHHRPPAVAGSNSTTPVTVEEYVGLERTVLSRACYPQADDVEPEQFEEALEEARAENNLSAANVIRKLGKTPKDRSIADRPDILKKTRRLDSNRIVEQTILAVQVSDEVLHSVDFAALDRDRLEGWVASLGASMRSLQTLLKQLKREVNPE